MKQLLIAREILCCLSKLINKGVCHNLWLPLYHFCGWCYDKLWFMLCHFLWSSYDILWLYLCQDLWSRDFWQLLPVSLLTISCFQNWNVSSLFKQYSILFRVLLKFVKPLALYISLATILFLDSMQLLFIRLPSMTVKEFIISSRQLTNNV